MPARFEYRPLHPAERAALAPPARLYRLRALPWPVVHFFFYLLIAWLAFAAFGSLLIAALGEMGVPFDRLPEAAAPVIGIAIYAALCLLPGLVVYRRWRRDTRRDRERARDLREGSVEVIHVEDAALAALPGLVDGSFLLCDLGEGRSLLLDRDRMRALSELHVHPAASARDTLAATPAALHAGADAVAFPCRSFVLHRLPHSGQSLQLQPLGGPCALPPVPEHTRLRASDTAAFRDNPDCDALVLPRAFAALVPGLSAEAAEG